MTCASRSRALLTTAFVGLTSGFATNASSAPLRVCHRADSGQVVGGFEAAIEDWPSFVAFRAKTSDGEIRYFCGGTAISATAVLTAAHCADHWKADSSGVWRSLDGVVEAVVATANLRNVSSSQVRSVASVVLHEKWSGILERGNDIAVVNLRPPGLTSVSRLSTAASSDKAGLVYVAGFGVTSGATGAAPSKWKSPEGVVYAGSPTLQEVPLPIVAAKTCSGVYRALDPSGTLCAGREEGTKDSCWGDSGGPLVALDVMGCSYQVGIVSFGNGCAAKNAYGVYTRVSSYASWIRSHAPAAATSESIVPLAAGVVTRQDLSTLLTALANLSQGGVQAALTRGNKLHLGDKMVLEIRSQTNGQPIIIDEGASGKIAQLFPNSNTSNAELMIEAQRLMRIPGPLADYDFQALTPGKGRLIVIVMPDKHAKWSADVIQYDVVP